MDERLDDLSTDDRSYELSEREVQHDEDETVIFEEVKIEEVGIDGMCGVY